MTPLRRILAVLATITAIAVLTGCTPGANVEKKTEAEATQLVTQRAEQVVALVGNTKLENPATSSSTCTGKLGESSDTVFTVQGVWNMKIPPGTHLDVINRLRDTWRAQNYKITTDVVSGQEGNLTGEDPDGFSINVTSTLEAGYMRLVIHTPCFDSPTPR